MEWGGKFKFFFFHILILWSKSNSLQKISVDIVSILEKELNLKWKGKKVIKTILTRRRIELVIVKIPIINVPLKSIVNILHENTVGNIHFQKVRTSFS